MEKENVNSDECSPFLKEVRKNKAKFLKNVMDNLTVDFSLILLKHCKETF